MKEYIPVIFTRGCEERQEEETKVGSIGERRGEIGEEEAEGEGMEAFEYLS